MKTTLFLLSIIALSGCGVQDRLWQWISTEEEDPRIEILEDFRSQLTIKRQWTAKLGGEHTSHYGSLHARLQDNTIFACTAKGTVGAWSPENGKKLWQKDYKTLLSSCIGGGESVLVLGTVSGHLIGLSAQNGEELWRKTVAKRAVTSVSESHQNRILVRTSDNQLFAVTTNRGQYIWSQTFPTPILIVRGMSSPLFYKNYALVGLDDGRLLLIRLRDGAIEREVRVGIAGRGTDLEKIVDIDGRIVRVGSLVYVAAYQGRTLAYDVDSDQLMWLSPLGSYMGLTADKEKVYLTDSDQDIQALDRLSGQSIWKQTLLGIYHSSAGLRYRDFFVVGDSSGHLNWLDDADGTLLARQKMFGHPITSPPMLWRDSIIAIDEHGRMASYRVTARRTPSSTDEN